MYPYIPLHLYVTKTKFVIIIGTYMKNLLENSVSSEVDISLLEVVIGGGNRILSVINDKGIVHYINQGRFLPEFNLTEHHRGKNYAEIIVPGEHSLFEALLEECKHKGKLDPDKKFTFLVADSQTVPLSLDELHYLKDSGKFVLFLVPQQDIGLIAQPDEQYKALFLRNPLPMWIFEVGTFKFLEVNEAAIIHYGYSREEFLSMTVRDLRTPDENVKFTDYIAKQTERNTFRVAGVWKHTKKDGSEIYVDINSRIVQFNDTEGVLVLVKDVTSQHLAEMELKQSELRLRTLINISDEMVVQLDQNLQTFYVSNNVNRILGYTLEEYLAHKTFTLLHSDDIGATQKLAADVIANPEKPFVILFRVQHKNGHYVWFECTAVNMLNVEGIGAIILSLHDVTESKTGLDIIKQNAETIATVLNSITDAFYVIDKNWVVKYWNTTVEKLAGVKREDVIGKDLREIFDTLKPGTMYFDAFTRAMETGKPERIISKGERINAWLDISLYPTDDGLTIYFKDVSEQKRREAELKQSELRLRTLINNSNEVIVQIDKNSTVTYVSENITRILGYTVNELLAGESFTLTHPDDAEMIRQATINNFANPGPSAPLVYRMRHKSGHYIWVEATSINMLDVEEINAIVISLRDVTESKSGIDALKENVESISTILDSISDSFYVLDKDWKVKYWNRAAEIFIGKKREEVMGMDIRDCFPSLQNEKSVFTQAFRQVIETGEPQRIEGFGESTSRWLDTSVYPTNGGGLSVYLRDISERKKHEAELRLLNDVLTNRAKELAASNAELERFAYVASHDLQEPLRMVSSFMQLLKRKYNDELDPIAQQYIYYAVDGAERMNQLILDLLQYSRVGTNKDHFVKVDLNQSIAQVSDLFQSQLSELNANLTVASLPTVTGVKSQLSQLFQNLISNAIKYRSNNLLQININVTDEGSHWQFTVADNGIGIEEVYFEKIFVIFQRLHNKDEYTGTGIGLAVCKKIVDRHGGKIWVKSTPGAGSTFYFTIPKKLML